MRNKVTPTNVQWRRGVGGRGAGGQGGKGKLNPGGTPDFKCWG